MYEHFLIGTDFWRRIPRDSLKYCGLKSVGGHVRNAKSIAHYITYVSVGLSPAPPYTMEYDHFGWQNAI